MASLKDDSIGLWWDTDEHMLVRARMVRSASIKWAPPVRDYPLLYSVLLKAPKHTGDRWLAVFKATTEDGEMVAFYKGTTLLSALGNGLSAVFSHRVKWIVEKPYRPPHG